MIVGDGVKQLVDLEFEGNDGLVSAITTTEAHPFYSIDRGWVVAGNLAAGDLLRTNTINVGKVTSVTHYARSQPVLNLTVTGFHTFYVVPPGGVPLLVHNAKCNTSVYASNRRQAAKLRQRLMKRMRERGYECRTRGACSSRDHLHIDWTRRGREGTVHVRWGSKGRNTT